MTSGKPGALAGPMLAVLPLVTALVFATVLGNAAPARGDRSLVRLPGHVPQAAFAARAERGVAADEPISLALALPLRNQAALEELLRRQYDPADPLYGRYLTPEEFRDQFAPTDAQYLTVAAFVRSRGLKVTGTHPNRLLMDVSGPAGLVEQAFATRLARMRSASGREIRAPIVEPAVPAELVGTLSGIVGLDDQGGLRPHCVLRDGRLSRVAAPNQTGSGPGGGLTPSDIKTAYSLAGSSPDGSGQTLALFELDGYKASDVTAYEDRFSLRHVPLQNVLVDGVTGVPSTGPNSGAGEVTLDIELQAALAPGVSKILVYEGPNTFAGVVDTYNRIATDNLAKSVSTSWGLDELDVSASTRNAENSIFQQMAAQGQSIFAASGDRGAFDDGVTLSVDDPASQPFMTGVGGTSLTTSGAGGPRASETTWNDGSAADGGGGGGISAVWPIPSYQQGLAAAQNEGSATRRNVPDVSLDSDPDTGYAIFFGGHWVIFGGTSCAAPLWSAFTACANQARAGTGRGPLGFMNPTLYGLGRGSRGTADFHDIADGSTNLSFPAVTGYDEATGWGTLNGANLLTDLTSAAGATLDTRPPAISGVQVAPRAVPAAGGTVTVSATVIDAGGVAGASVILTASNGLTTRFPLARGARNVFSARLPAQANRTRLTLSFTLAIVATDTSGNVGRASAGTVTIRAR